MPRPQPRPSYEGLVPKHFAYWTTTPAEAAARAALEVEPFDPQRDYSRNPPRTFELRAYQDSLAPWV